MRETYYAGVYWGRRQASAEESARRAETFFRLLSDVHPDYARWFEQHDSEEPITPIQIEPTRDTFMRLFAQEENQRGLDGYYFGAWTGHEDQGQGGAMNLFCGAHSEGASNHSLLYFPVEDPGRERLLTTPVLAGVMRAMALAWEPDWGVVVSGDFRDTLSEQGSAGTFMGWMTYFSRSRGQVPALPPPARVEPVSDQGSLVILTPERLSGRNPEHLDLGRRVQSLLAAQGLLERVIPSRFPSGT